MPNKFLVAIIVGTRPEAIKLAPVLLQLRASSRFETLLILTGQHREMVLDALNLFSITADENLDLMKPDQTLTDITVGCLEGLERIFTARKPSLVVVQGDTTSAFAGALAAFYRKIPVCHVEAGLRTDDLFVPYPEEANRRIISQIATIHCAPTERAMQNLRASRVPGEIHLTGNTTVDALQMVLRMPIPELPSRITGSDRRILFATVHRTESRGSRLAEICRAFITILDRFPDTELVLPMHPNPQVRKPIKQILGYHERAILIEPVVYHESAALLQRCFLVLTDSGGLQEEAPSLGKPVIVLREMTERQELIEAGGGVLTGADHDAIVNAASTLLMDASRYKQMSHIRNPFGDGHAAEKITAIVQRFLCS